MLFRSTKQKLSFPFSLSRKMFRNSLALFSIREMYKNSMGYRKLGLRLHDIVADSLELREAVRRMPADLREERDWRLKRAYDLNVKKIELPKDEWTKPEDDAPYLRPYLDDVRQEEHDRLALNPID